MTKRLSVPAIFLCVIIFSSCGTQKKLDASMKEADSLKTANTALKKENESLKTESSRVNADLASLRKENAENQKKLQAVDATKKQEQEQLQALHAKLDKALSDFENHGVDVYEKDGHLYVSLAENILYKTGSAALDSKGKEALGSLANVLNEYPQLEVIVMGNTDDQMFKKGTDNWTLSTERANGVIRVLRDDYKVDPARLIAAGQGRYNPVADNKTEEGRAKNRRTEIILNPDWNKLWESSGKN